VNDRLCYQRRFETSNVTVTCLCRVVNVDKDGYASVITTINDVKRLSPGFRSLSDLEAWILDVDGRMLEEDYPSYDLYKAFFLFRFKGTIYDLKNQYVTDHKIQGSIFETLLK
jgi:hypothetical protein